MKYGKCPSAKCCYDYDCSNCDECIHAGKYQKLHRKIAKLQHDLAIANRALEIYHNLIVDTSAGNDVDDEVIAILTVPDFAKQQAEKELKEENKYV